MEAKNKVDGNRWDCFDRSNCIFIINQVKQNFMWILLLWWFGGVILRFLFSLVFDPSFKIRHNVARMALSVAIGFLPAYLFYKMGMKGDAGKILLVVCGFLSQYILEWVNKRKG